MSLTRTEYAHAKYPWEYTTEELLSLFEITRDSQLLTAGRWQDSGIIESLKMLEQQLRFLSIIAYKRVEKFSGHEGEIACLYSSNIVPTLAVQNITYDGGAVSHIMDWIDNLRSDYGLSAWSWSNTGRTLFNIALVKELWYATGLINRNLSFSIQDPYASKLSVWYSSSWDSPIFYPAPTGPFYDTDFEGGTLESQKIWVFDEDTRVPYVNSYLLFAVDDTIQYSGTESWHFSKLLNIDDATEVFNYDTPISGELYLSDGETPGSGNNSTWKYVDITGHHPTSGSGYVYYKAALSSPSVNDGGYFNGALIQSGAYTPLCLWQTVTSNPYS